MPKAPTRRRSKKTASKRVSNKIRLLKTEGRPQKQAVAIALSMKRRGKLGKK